MIKRRKIKRAQIICLFPGLFLIVSGLLILFSPNTAGVIFDLKEIDQFKEPLALAMGIRQLAIGLMITFLALSSQARALGLVMLIGALVPLTDFLVFYPVIGWVSALRHAIPVLLIAGLGIYLLRQTRRGN